MKKLLCLSLSIVLVLALAAGCASQSGEPSPTPSADASPDSSTATPNSNLEDPREPIALTWVNLSIATGVDTRDNNGLVTQYVNDRFDLEINYEPLAIDEWEQLTLWMSAGTYPEVMIYNAHAGINSQAGRLGWANLDQYFDDPSRFPTLYNIKQTYSRQLANMTSLDGYIFGFPIGANFNPGEPSGDERDLGTWLVRNDILDMLGGTRPETLDEFAAFLRAAKDLDLRQGNGQPVYPLMMHPADYMFQAAMFYAHGVTWAGLAKDSWYAHWAFTQSGYEAMKFINQMWNEGLVDPDWATQQPEMFNEKVINGAGAVVIPAFYGDGGLINNILAAGNADYTALPIPRIPGVSRPVPQNNLPGPDPICVMYVTDKASPELIERLAEFAEWTFTDEGARIIALHASPDMIELKADGPFSGYYWYRDEFSDLDDNLNDDVSAARIRYGSLPLYQARGTAYSRASLNLPTAESNVSQWALDNAQWITANKNSGYLGDTGPVGPHDDAMADINNRIWGELPAMILRSVILTPDAFEREWEAMINEAIAMGAKELNDYLYAQHVEWMAENADMAAIPADFHYSEMHPAFR